MSMTSTSVARVDTDRYDHGAPHDHTHDRSHVHAPADGRSPAVPQASDAATAHEHDHGHGHEHGHDHGVAHVHVHGAAPEFSLVRASLALRLALAGGMSLAVWALVFWARLPIAEVSP